MNKSINHYKYLSILVLIGLLVSCNTPKSALKQVDENIPEGFTESNGFGQYQRSRDRLACYFDDPLLIALIDTALQNNQELNIVLQELAGQPE
jgi:multidrug efflux system outer membrane protein